MEGELTLSSHPIQIMDPQIPNSSNTAEVGVESSFKRGAEGLLKHWIFLIPCGFSFRAVRVAVSIRCTCGPPL